MKKTQIPLIFHDNNGQFLLLVKGNVNDFHGYFVIDTGASSSVIHKSFLIEKIKPSKNRIFDEIKGLGGNAGRAELFKIDLLKIETFDIKNAFLFVADLKEILDEFPKKIILGILGNDVLMKYCAEINYKKQILLLLAE